MATAQTSGASEELRSMPNATETGRSSSDLLIALDADIDLSGDFGLRSLEVTAEHVRVLEKGGAVSFLMPISEIASARNEPLVGGGRLEITSRAGEVLPIVSYTQSLAARFSEAARGIEQLAKGEPLSINLKPEQTRCRKCARLLPEKDGICPACVNRGRVLRRVGRYLAPYKGATAGLVALACLTTSLNLAPGQIQRYLINHVLQSHHDIGRLFVAMGWWLGVLFCASIVQIMTGRTTAFLAGHIAADLRSQLYRSIEFLQLGFFDKKQVGAITSRVTQDTDRVWGFLVDGLPPLVVNGLLLIGIAIFLTQTNRFLALAIITPVPIVLLIAAAFWRPISNLFNRVGQKWARLHMHLNESLSGIRVVKAFAQEDVEYNKFYQRNEELRRAGTNADSRWFTVFGAMTLFTGMGQLINWTVGGWLVYHHRLSLGDFWLFNTYLALIYGPLQWFGQLNNWFSRAMAGAERIFEIMDTTPEPYLGTPERRPIAGTVEFDNVRFGYDKSNPVIKGVTFTAKPGEMIGLVGKSGAGKSTTINLVCRFYEPDSGMLKIDGIDYRQIGLQELRRQIGLVLQEPFLFNGTIAENIAYGKPGVEFDEIVEAARAANAHEFILAKPDGYDTLAGERGAKLSGGERQRISIARAILHDPRILILDEATSSVDVETEKQIQEALGRLTSGRTTFAIAHRLSTLRHADRLIVLEAGQIVEMGTHAELMEKQGHFYKLVQTQTAATQIIGVGT